MHVSQSEPSLLLATIGIIAGLTWWAVTTSCFGLIQRWLGKRDGLNCPLRFVDVAAYLIGATVSVSYLIVFAVFAGRWIFEISQNVHSGIDVFWFGLVGTVGLMSGVSILRRQ